MTILSEIDSSKRTSFSQNGEDLIADFYFSQIGIQRPTYIDVGAYHPLIMSNTFSFYLAGSQGVLVEPNPNFGALMARHRPRDQWVQAAVVADPTITQMPYYEMDQGSINTLSKQDAEEKVARGAKLIAEKVVSTTTLNRIFEERFGGSAPDFMSLDVESLDLDLLKSIDFSCYRPKMIVVETVVHLSDGRRKKNIELIEYMNNNHYQVFADTFINTLFVRSR